MARQNINLGTAPGGLDGDDARTAFTKTNANFTELYGGTVLQPLNAKLSAISASVWAANQLMLTTGAGTLAMLATGSTGRALIAAADPAAGRTALAIGPAGYGDWGIGKASDTTWSDLNTVANTSVVRFDAATLNRPTSFAYGSAWCHVRSATEQTQFAVSTNSSGFGIRHKVVGSWSPWYEKTIVEILSNGSGGLLGNLSLDTTDPWLGNRFKGWANNSPTGPGGASLAVGLDMGYNPARRFQIALDTRGDFHTRVETNAEPTSNAGWRRMHSEATVVGPVRQNPGPGAPSAIIERGSNTNGEYTKYADGTMICRTTYTVNITTAAAGSIFRDLTPIGGIWTFPVSFIGSVQVNFSCRAQGVWVTTASANPVPSTTQASFVAYASQAYSNAGLTVDAVAIGRWY